MVAPDEGHGFAGKLNRLSMITAMEQFFAKHIGGCVQEDVRDEIKEKMDSIAVDVKTVEMPKPKEKGAAPANALAINPDMIKSNTLTYSDNIEIQGQKITGEIVCNVSRESQEGKELIRAVVTSSGAGAAGTEIIDYSADTLIPVKYHAAQGPVKIDVNYTPEGVSGSMSTGAQDMPLKIKYEQQIFPSKWGIFLPLSTLPLEAGYITTIHQFDLRTQSAKGVIVKVEGTEKKIVKTGTFDACKVSLTPVEGEGKGILWIDDASRKILKVETKLPPAMGAASIVYELVSIQK